MPSPLSAPQALSSQICVLQCSHSENMSGPRASGQPTCPSSVAHPSDYFWGVTPLPPHTTTPGQLCTCPPQPEHRRGMGRTRRMVNLRPRKRRGLQAEGVEAVGAAACSWPRRTACFSATRRGPSPQRMPGNTRCPRQAPAPKECPLQGWRAPSGRALEREVCMPAGCPGPHGWVGPGC